MKGFVVEFRKELRLFKENNNIFLLHCLRWCTES